MILDIASAPTTNTFLAAFVLINLSAIESAYIKPLQTAWISNAGHSLIFNFFCKIHAVLGKTLSGVVVATIIKSISFGCKFASLIAFFAASKAKSLVN